MLTVALSKNVQVKVGVFWIQLIKLHYHGPKFNSYGPFSLDIAKRIGDVGETSASWLVNVQQVGK